jgi:perosamine synthetase
LKRIDSILARRAWVADAYDQRLREILEVELPARGNAYLHCSWFVYVVRLRRTGVPGLRDAVAGYLQAQAIGCGRYFAPVHMQPAYAECRDGAELPITEAEAATTLALPFFNRITIEQIDQVCAALLQALRS